MQKRPNIRKGLAVGIILLFIGVTIAPSINFTVVKASNDNNLVEVTTQACGIKGYGNTTMKLTRQQYQNLEQYLVDFRGRLNQTTTKEEVVPIFNEAVVELNKYGLLPKGMSVEKAQRLVTGLYQNTKLIKYLEKLLNKSGKSLLQEGNKLCLIYGKSKNNTYFQGPVSKAIYNLLAMPAILYDSIFDSTDGIAFPLLFFIAVFFLILAEINAYVFLKISENIRDLPHIGSIIYYGSVWWRPPEGPLYYPTEGSIWTIGSFGIKNWSGQFYGKLPYLIDLVETFWATLYPGAYGFTGLRLYLNSSDFYFGFALNVNVGPEPPQN